MSTDERVVIVHRDTERQRDMYWYCNVNRFGYYDEHATVFDSESDARTIMKYCGVEGEIRPEASIR